MKYKHILKPNIKNIYIKIDKDANIILTSSKKREQEAIELLYKKKEWIKNAQKRQLSKTKRENIYKNGGVLYYLGNAYPLIFIKNKKPILSNVKKANHILLDEDKFLYFGKQKYCEKALLSFYKQKSKELFTQRVKHYSDILKLFPKDIKFRKMKRRFGSCSQDNTLTFNILCLKMPLLEIDYVVVHELCHIKHKNHSSSFWSEVAKIFPNYKQIKERITL